MLDKRVHVNGRSKPGATARISAARRLIRILVLGNAAVLCSAAGLRGQGNGAIEGRVSDEQGRPLSEVLLTVDGTSLSALTDDAGSFSLARVPGGGQRLRTERLGFRPEVRDVVVSEGVTLRVEIRLTTRPVEVEDVRVTVIGSAAETAEMLERLRQVPGAVALIESEAIESSRQANLKDVLRFTPGVYVQPRFGAADESQLSIRGSGLRNNFHLRGVNVLVNGMPYRNADGFTDFESLELLTVDNMQVYKGGNALRFGGSTLGGAINLQTKTGHTAEPVKLFAQGGSWGFFKAQGASGAAFGSFDYYGSYARTNVNGYRQHAENERDRVNAHAGWRISPRVDLRGFYFMGYVREDLPGSLTREEFEENPRQANPANVLFDWGRDYTLHHVGVQLRAEVGSNQTVEVSPYFQHRDIVHPIFRVLDQTSNDGGLEARYENRGTLGGRPNRLTFGAQGALGEIDNQHFENEEGESGDLAKDQLEDAGGFAFYGENVFSVSERFSAIVGVRYDRSRRGVEDFFLEDGDQSDERWFEAVLPKLGFTYELPTVGGQVFANASRMFEPPLLLELSSLTIPGFIPLDAQDAWQFEAGTRGQSGGVDWLLSLYDIELRDEIININVQPFPGAPFTVPTYRNAERTRHYGVEAGFDYTASRVFDRGGLGDALGVVLAYTFARYEFVRDSVFTGNEIPGAPPHVLQAEVVYRHPVGLTLRPNLEWVPSSYFLDSANTEKNDGWAVLGFRTEWKVDSIGLLAFVELRNLTDVNYSPAVTVDDAAGQYFLPADARSIYGGVQWNY